MASVSLVLSLGSCGDGTGATGGSGGAASAPLRVCGDGGIGFVGQIAGGNQDIDVYRELGFVFVAIDPACRFVATESVPGHLGTAFVGTLTAAQAAEVSAFLALDQWEELDPVYGAAVCGGSSARYAVGEQIFEVVPSCGAVAFPGPPNDFPHSLARLASELASMLRDLGTPATGDVRYQLLRERAGGNPPPAFNAGAATWPLDVPIDSLSVPPIDGSANRLSPVWTATGEDADKLRAVRVAFLEGEFGFDHEGAMPLADTDGSRFYLFVRDVIEFESASGEASVCWVDFNQPLESRL
ncbi:MAG: hypothetical protein AAGF92_24160 [Myxococcota bacterium]